MTTENNELELRIQDKGEGAVNAEGRPEDAFNDPTGQFPRGEYHDQPSVNKVIRGDDVNELDLRNGIPGVDTDLTQKVATQYPMASVNESVSGHIIEINDTPGGERILIKHNTGAGIDIKSDGSIIINAKQNRIDIVEEDHRLVVEGDGNVSYYGNLNMNVSGDYNLTVGGNYNLKVKGNWIADVIGSYKKKIHGIMGEVVLKSKSVTVMGQTINTHLSNVGNFIKGTYQQMVKKRADYNHGAEALFNSESEINMTSPKVNIAATDLSVIGAQGTIGGQNIIYYGKNMHLENTIHSPTASFISAYGTTFHGSLNGTANFAVQSSIAGGIGVVQIPSVQINNDAVDNTQTQKPTSSEITDLLTNNEIGPKKVSIDENNEIKNFHDKTVTSGGITTGETNTRETRSKLKDKKNIQNTNFVADRVADGVLSSSFASGVPGQIEKVKGKATTPRIGHDIIGQTGRSTINNKYKPSDAASKARTLTFSVDARFNPNNLSQIEHTTLLGKGIPISKFTGGVGEKTTLNHIVDVSKRKQAARNLLVQAHVIEIFRQLSLFKGFNLVVAEGIYQPGPGETPTPESFNDLAQDGRAVAYEVYSQNGQIALDKLFDFAEFLKDAFSYNKLTLAFDKFNPDKTLHGQLLVEIPTIPESYRTQYDMKLETTFNSEVQSSSDLVEILS